MKQCCEKYMVEDYLEALYSEAKSIISQERQQDMANMYILLHSVPKNLIPYMSEFKDHIIDEGLHRLDEIKGDNVSELWYVIKNFFNRAFNFYKFNFFRLQMCMSFVEIIMSIYKKYKEIIEKIFQSDKSFTGALDKACIHIVNYSPDNKSYKSSELVC